MPIDLAQRGQMATRYGGVRLLRILITAAVVIVIAAGAFAFVRLRPPELPPDRAAPVARYPLRVSADRRYLVDQRGVPFLVRGEAAWSIVVQPTREEVEHYLEDRRRRGFNLLMVNLVEHAFADNAPRNAYGEPPFTTPGDFGTPNEAYFAHADWVLKQAAAKGFAVLLCPAYLGYDGGWEGWYQDIVKNGPEKMREWGRYVGQRYASLDNIVWLEAGDFTPPPDEVALVDAVALGIREKDSRHLHAAHWSPETSGADVPVQGWLDVNTTYSIGPVYRKALADYLNPVRRPSFFVEGWYEGEHGASTQFIRAQAWYAVLSGAAGEIFGTRTIWKFQPPKLWRKLAGRAWTSSLDSAGTRSVQHLRELLGSLRWWELEPDHQNQVLVGGQGEKGTMDYAVLSRTRDGRLALAYLPARRAIELDLSRLARPLRARWFDPSSGRFSALQGPALAPARRVRVQPNGENAGGDDDWVLVLDAPPAR